MLKALRPYYDLSYSLREKPGPMAYAVSAAVALVAELAVFAAEHMTPEKFSNITSFLILSVLYSAIYLGKGPAILNALMCTMLFDYFFIPPFFEPTHSVDNTIKFAVFVLVALMANVIAGKARDYAMTLQQKEQRIRIMHLLTERLLSASSEAEIAQHAGEVISQTLQVNAFLVLGDEELDNPRLPRYTMRIPIRTAQHYYGWLYVLPAKEKVLTEDVRQLLPTLAGHITINLERLHLRADKEQAMVDKEREGLRAALYCSVSHDLKTPLSSIIGATSTLQSVDGRLTKEAQQQLVTTIHDEAERLHHFVNNMLESARLEHQPPQLETKAVDIDDALDEAIKKMRAVLATHKLVLDIPQDLPQLLVDPRLIETVFTNLLSNAVKFSSAGSAIRITAASREQHLILHFDDEGAGIAPEEYEQVFNKFYRIAQADRRIAGTGLGLYICRTIMQAHGGAIIAERSPAGGCRITLSFPPSRTTLSHIKDAA